VPDFLHLPADLYFGEVTGVAVNSKSHIFVFSSETWSRLAPNESDQGWGKGSGKVRTFQAAGADPAGPSHPARPSCSEEKACGVACRIGVGGVDRKCIESVSLSRPRWKSRRQLAGQAVPAGKPVVSRQNLRETRGKTYPKSYPKLSQFWRTPYAVFGAVKSCVSRLPRGPETHRNQTFLAATFWRRRKSEFWNDGPGAAAPAAALKSIAAPRTILPDPVLFLTARRASLEVAFDDRGNAHFAGCFFNGTRYPSRLSIQLLWTRKKSRKKLREMRLTQKDK
jgi:hypothetical protein